MEKQITIDGVCVTLRVRAVHTNYGEVFVASNNYGEPKMRVVAFSTLAEALANEEQEVRAMCA